MTEYYYWERVIGFGAVAEHLDEMLRAGCLGLEFKKIGLRNNSYLDETGKGIDRFDLVVDSIDSVLPAIRAFEPEGTPTHKFYPAVENHKAFIVIPKKLVNIEPIPIPEYDPAYDSDEDYCPHCGGDL